LVDQLIIARGVLRDFVWSVTRGDRGFLAPCVLERGACKGGYDAGYVEEQMVCLNRDGKAGEGFLRGDRDGQAGTEFAAASRALRTVGIPTVP